MKRFSELIQKLEMSNKTNDKITALVEYFNEGISVDDSITYIARGVEAVKARGLIDNDIAQSLSDGWL